MSIAKSILQLSKSKLVKNIILSGSEDLKCVNMFCEKVGGPCICRIERVLSRDDLKDTVEELDLSSNNLSRLPPSLYKLNSLKVLNLSDNQLESLETKEFSLFTSLEAVDITKNHFKDSLSVATQLQKLLPNAKINFD
jgi:Leucine-rich repeat (LRR) protein